MLYLLLESQVFVVRVFFLQVVGWVSGEATTQTRVALLFPVFTTWSNCGCCIGIARTNGGEKNRGLRKKYGR